MAIIDIILLVILGYFTLWGFKKGLIRAVGAIVGLIAAIVLASRYFEEVAEVIAPFIGLSDNMNLAKMAAFILLLFAINYIVSIIVAIVEKMYKAIAILPFMKLGNRLLGAVLGLLQASLMIGLILYFAARFPFGSIVEVFFEDSKVAPIVLQISGLVQPFIPDAIRQIESLI
jgi:uncharacterized membrane protein required for colicin V production